MPGNSSTSYFQEDGMEMLKNLFSFLSIDEQDTARIASMRMVRARESVRRIMGKNFEKIGRWLE